MKEVFSVNKSLHIPIYRQLADRIRAAANSGDLPAGERLPTVRELADQLSVARGTVKRAYDELEKQDVLKKIRGRGTFVAAGNSAAGSRKDRAMKAIDRLLDELDQMSFSPAEIQIFLSLKTQERAARYGRKKIAVIGEDRDILHAVAEELRALPHTDVYPFTADDIAAYPFKLKEDFSAICAFPPLLEHLKEIIPDPAKLVPVVSAPDPLLLASLLAAAKAIPRTDTEDKPCTIGILCKDASFAHAVTGDPVFSRLAAELSLSLKDFSLSAHAEQDTALSAEDKESAAISAQDNSRENTPGNTDNRELMQFVQNTDLFLLPPSYPAGFPENVTEIIRTYVPENALFSWKSTIDQGSLFLLKEHLNRLPQE